MPSSKLAVIGTALPLLLLLGGAAAPPHAAAEAGQARDWRPAPPPPPPPRQGYRRPEPVGSERWITAEDYPVPALREEAEGRVSVRYLVRADGRVQDCTILSASGHWALDQATCPLLTARARYRPARDERGRPMPVTVNQGVQWTLPYEPEPVALAAGTVVIELPGDGRSALTCGKQASIPSLMQLASDLCAVLFPEPGAEGAGEGAASTVVATLATGREPPLRAPRPPGTLAASLEVQFDVMADGSVRNCAVAAASGPRLELCDLLSAGDPYFEPARGATPRQARMTVAVYTSAR